MNRNTLIIAVLLLVVGLLAGALVTRAQSSEWTGTKWEYAQIFSTTLGITMIFTPDASEQVAINDSYSALPKNKQGASSLLQLAGTNGWELVTLDRVISGSGDSVTTFYLKREIPS